MVPCLFAAASSPHHEFQPLPAGLSVGRFPLEHLRECLHAGLVRRASSEVSLWCGGLGGQ